MGKRGRRRAREAAVVSSGTTTVSVSAQGYDRLADLVEERDPERARRYRLIARARQYLAQRRLGRR